jgi:hypothetical protein
MGTVIDWVLSKLMPVISFLIVMAGGSAVYYRQKSKITELEKDKEKTHTEALESTLSSIRSDRITQDEIISVQAAEKAKWDKQMEADKAFRDEVL